MKLGQSGLIRGHLSKFGIDLDELLRSVDFPGRIVDIADDEDRVEMTVNAYIKDSGSSELNSAFGSQFIERFKYEVSQHLAILEHKKHLEKPLLCAGDGDILRWRRYTGRFYSWPSPEAR